MCLTDLYENVEGSYLWADNLVMLNLGCMDTVGFSHAAACS